MRLGSWLVLSIVTLGVSAPACMYPEFGFRDETGAGGTTATGTPTGGGFGGSTSTGTPSGGGATSTGTGGTGGTPTGTGGTAGTGGTPPTPCDLWGADVCEPTEKCSVINTANGDTGCVDAGPRPVSARCENDTECVDGTWCDLKARVCKELCQDGNDCNSSAYCLPAPQSDSGTIPGLEVCTTHCDPRDPLSCNQSSGAVNCVYDPPDGFDCMSCTSNTAIWDDCSDSRQCVPGLGCYYHLVGGTICRPWCNVGGSSCLVGCYSHAPAVDYDGTEIGSCR